MAATFTVGTTSDPATSCQAPASGTCSLRQLINFENTLAPSSPADTIVVPAGLYSLTGGELLIFHSVAIAGAGARVTDVAQPPGSGARVFDIGLPEGGSIPNVVISGLEISGGNISFGGSPSDSGFGADVRNLATLTLDHDWITGGTTTAGSGGGISNEGGTMTISNSLVSGNASVFSNNSGGDSGGVQNFGPNPDTGTPGHLTIVNSTIANNTSDLGGGVFSWCGGGGGPCSSPAGANNTTSIVNSTIANNDGGIRGTTGGGLLFTQGTLSIQNSIVAGNTVKLPSAGRASNCGGTAGAIVSAGHNMESGTDCGFHAAGDISGTSPGFTSSAPQNNGGDTNTLGLPATSPAVDAIQPGTSGCGGTDQRGTSRPQGSGCDIGAYELFQPQEGSAFSTQVALATVGVTGAITIAWGDGTTSTGTLASGRIGPILGTHTYARAGIYNGTVTWTDAKGSKSATFSMKVTDAPLSATGLTIAARVGTPFNGAVATFTDPNPFAAPADFSATINWGDGTSSAGTVSGGGAFVVAGTHAFASPGVYQTTVAIRDVGGASAQARSSERDRCPRHVDVHWLLADRRHAGTCDDVHRDRQRQRTRLDDHADGNGQLLERCDGEAEPGRSMHPERQSRIGELCGVVHTWPDAIEYPDPDRALRRRLRAHRQQRQHHRCAGRRNDRERRRDPGHRADQPPAPRAACGRG
jgi:hypothetical protein